MLVINMEKGLIEVPDRFTAAEKEQIERMKDLKKFKSNNLKYAGHCLRCGKQVNIRDASYLENKDGLGNIEVDLFHILCSK